MRKYVIAVALLMTAVPGLALAQGTVKVTSMYGPVEIEFASGARLVPARATSPDLDVGDVIHTGDDATLTLELPDGSYMVVNENTRLRIEKFWGSETRNLMHVILGKVRFYIQRLGGRPNPYRVETPTALIAVRGTTFEVRVAPGSTEVFCFDGRVSVETAGMPDREVILDGGRKTLVRPGVYPAAPVAMDDVFDANRVLRVVRQEETADPDLVPVPGIEAVAGDNDRRNRSVDPLANPDLNQPAGQDIRRGKLSYPGPGPR